MFSFLYFCFLFISIFNLLAVYIIYRKQNQDIFLTIGIYKFFSKKNRKAWFYNTKKRMYIIIRTIYYPLKNLKFFAQDCVYIHIYVKKSAVKSCDWKCNEFLVSELK